MCTVTGDEAIDQEITPVQFVPYWTQQLPIGLDFLRIGRRDRMGCAIRFKEIEHAKR